jgi:flavin reductase (DIM6/NTAB) family NADH-FMN oxidoreductase RutF
VSYSAINERYAPRATLAVIRDARRFACGVPYASDDIVEFITFAGNASLNDIDDKLGWAGLATAPVGASPVLADLPLTFDCRVVGEVRLGTHVMFLGEVDRIFVRNSLSARDPLHWCPWATILG